MTWAFDLDLKPASSKFILVALADNADDQGRAFPSLASLVKKTSLDRKTVISAIDQLEQIGLLRDTGERVGQTGQVKVYQLIGFNGSENGTIPKTEQFRNSVETVPFLESPSPLINPSPSRNPQGTQRGRAISREEPPPSNLNVEAWHRWEQYRQAIGKRIKPASMAAAQRKLAGFGASQAAVVEQSIANGWQGLFPLREAPARKEKSEWQ
jgi:Helix-turn-helix domain